MEAEAVYAERGVVLSETSVVIPSAATWKPSLPTHEDASSTDGARLPETPAEKEVEVEKLDTIDATDAGEIEDHEHLQLTLQEAFFLMWSLDCLSVLSPSTVGSVYVQ